MLSIQAFFDAAVENVKKGDWLSWDEHKWGCTYRLNAHKGCFIGQLLINKNLLTVEMVERNQCASALLRNHPELNFMMPKAERVKEPTDKHPEPTDKHPLDILQGLHDNAAIAIYSWREDEKIVTDELKARLSNFAKTFDLKEADWDG